MLCVANFNSRLVILVLGVLGSFGNELCNFCHVLLARVPPRCVSLCRSPEMIFHGHPWLLKVVRPGSPLNEEPRPTLLYIWTKQVISCRVASAVVALEGIFLGNNHSNREAQCLVRKDMGPWTILIAVATPIPDSQHKQTNKQSLFFFSRISKFMLW